MRCQIWLILSLLLASTERAEAARGAEQAYEAADLIPGEYGQDLAQAKAEADWLLSQPGDKSWAELYAARVYRLRGDYTQALEYARRAQRATDARAQAYALVEKRWTEFERMQTPWGSLNPMAPDRLCKEPTMVVGIQGFLGRLGALLGKGDQATQQRLAGAFALAMLEQQIENAAMAADIGVQHRSTVGLQHHPGLIEHMQRGAKLSIETLQKIARSNPPFARHIERVAERVLPLAWARVDLTAELGQQFPCSPERVAADAMRALTCAERLLFPGGVAEDLGHSVQIGLLPGSAAVPEIEAETAFETLAAWYAKRKPNLAQAAAWLTLAERGLPPNSRGAARLSFVRGADLLGQEIVRDAKTGSDVTAAIGALRQALDLGQRTADGVLVRRTQALLAFAYAMAGQRRKAETSVVDLLRDSENWPAQSVAFGGLFDALARALYEHRFDASTSARLAAISERLYGKAGAEASSSLMQRAEQFELMGMAPQAMLTNNKAWLTLFPHCDINKPEKCQFEAPRCVIPNFLPGEFYKNAILIADQQIRLAYNLRDDQLLARWNRAQLALLEVTRPPAGARAETVQADAEKAKKELADCNTIQNPDLDARAQAQEDCRRALLPRFYAGFGKPLAWLMIEQGESLAVTGAFYLANLADRQKIIEKPELSRTQRYLDSIKIATNMQTSTRVMFMVASYLAADLEEKAQQHWIKWKESIFNQDRTDNQQVTALGGFEKRHKILQALNIGMYAAKVRDFTESERQLRALQDLAGGPQWYERTRDPSAGLFVQIATMSGLGRHKDALKTADYAVALLEDRRRVAGDQRLRGALYSQTRIQDVFNAAILAASRAGDAERVFSYTQRAKARALQDGLLYRGELAQGQDQRVLLERALSELSLQLEHCPSTTTGECACRLAERDKLERALDEEQAQGGGDTQSAPTLSAAEVASQLPPGTLLLDYYLGTEYLHVVVLARGASPSQAALRIPNPAEIQGRLERLRRHMGSSHRESLPEVQQDLQVLARLLLQAGPVQKALADPRRTELVLVPHGILHTVPFSMLPFQGKPLVSRYTLRYLPFASLPPLRSRPFHAPTATILFSPGDSVDSPRTRALSRDRKDVHNLQSVYGSEGRVVMDASRADLLAAFSTSAVVHVIAHSTAGTGPSESAWIDLMQSGCQSQQCCDRGDLSVADLYGAPFTFTARLAFLDTCLAAVGRNQSGDENVGFPRALLQKGVAGVIAPLWEVEDNTSQNLGESFHRLYKGGAVSAAAALAGVQREAIRSGQYAYRWAGYSVFGWE